ncbi:hypothetical protein ACN22W_22555 [Burkholderia theae]|uniref:hypothetical protein n=1 Tax=Burkholderia theae TaxID=3143496 RepID=UPI003AFA51C6
MFALPNHSGILCFAGDGSSAYRFWAALSDKWATASGYDPLVRVSQEMLQDVFRENSEDIRKISIFGALIDLCGNRTAIFHNFELKIETKQFGTCYIAGSGARLVEQIIRRVDQNLTNSRGWPEQYPISATEDLAEHISCEMLHAEGSFSNGILPGTPLDLRCGGYYDWIKIYPDGIRPMRPRIDLSVAVEKDELIIYRAYFFEHQQLMLHTKTNSQRICTSVVNMGMEFSPIKIPQSWGGGYEILFDETWGTSIPSFFFGHHYEDDVFRNQLFGRMNAEIIEKDFSPPLEVNRIRVIVKVGSSTAIQKRFITKRGSGGDGVLSCVNGKLSLWLSPRLLEMTVKTARFGGDGGATDKSENILAE